VIGAIDAKRLVRDLLEHDAFGVAASVAFWFFLSLVPLLVLAGFLVGQVARARGMDALTGPLLDIVPGSAEDLVRGEIVRLAGSRTSSIAPLGALGFLWSASSGLHNLMDVIEVAVDARRLAWWWQRTMALGWVIVGLATACGLALVLVQVDSWSQLSTPTPTPTPTPTSRTSRPSAHGAAPAHPRPDLGQRVHKALQKPVDQAVAAGLMLLAGTALLSAFYRFAVEHPPLVRRRIWPGAITAVGSWLAVSWVFGAYAASLANYAVYYGSLAAVAILLLWLYLTSLSLVVGAEVNAQLEGVRSALSRAPRPARA
jgi:membrane protein